MANKKRKKKKKHKSFDILKGSIPRAAILIIEQSLMNILKRKL